MQFKYRCSGFLNSAYQSRSLRKNTPIERNPITLKTILEEIYAVISEAKALVGGRIIILECEDSPKLIALYEQHGFTLIETDGDDQPKLRTMYINVAERLTEL